MTLALLDDVKLDGFPVEQLYPGWSPVSRTPVADDFSVMVFAEEETGREACWWLEGDDFRASHVLALEPSVQARLLKAMDPVFWPLATGVLGAVLPDGEAPSCDSLPEIAVNELSGSWLGGFAPHTLLLASGHADSGEALVCQNGRRIAENRMTALLSAQRESGRKNGSLIVSSPFTALPLLAQITFQADNLSISRFQDDGTVFYLAWNDNLPDSRPSFYYPDAPLLISDDPGAAVIPGLVLSWYARHPEHVTLIREAKPFKAEDFGVGQASGLKLKPATEDFSGDVAAEQNREHQLLHSPTSPLKDQEARSLHAASAPQPQPAKQGLKSRIKSLFGRQ